MVVMGNGISTQDLNYQTEMDLAVIHVNDYAKVVCLVDVQHVIKLIY